MNIKCKGQSDRSVLLIYIYYCRIHYQVAIYYDTVLTVGGWVPGEISPHVTCIFIRRSHDSGMVDLF